MPGTGPGTGTKQAPCLPVAHPGGGDNEHWMVRVEVSSGQAFPGR